MEPNIVPAYGCSGNLAAAAAPPEYRCVTRLRHRRLLTFLWLHGFRSTFEAMAEETKVLVSLPRLERLITSSMWDDAIGYICRFLPPSSGSTGQRRRRGSHLSEEAQTLLLFLHMHKSFADVVAGNKAGAAWSDKHRRLYAQSSGLSPYSHAARIRRSILSFVLSDRTRESLDWGRVREQVAQIVRSLLHSTPELVGFVDLPGGMVKPHNVLPIGFGFRSKRHVRQQSHPQASTIAKLYLEMKRCLPSSGQPQGLSLEGLSNKARSWMADILDLSLRAGCKRSEHHEGYPLQSSEKKGSLVAAITQTMFSTITTDTENSGIASATKTGVPASTVLQTLIGTMISPGKKSGISSVTNAGTDMHSSQEDCHTENYCQGFTPRKHPREEVEPEEDISPKRQQTTVKFGEASVSLIGVAEAEGKARLVELSM
ncbi:uncharacterized protein [Oryza sativa Japonica Group]|uniref:Os07g0199000 protein n=1 Tax=Oryza sativa subsp. japonica TaxID=39947 RepID=A0A0P0X480_ORYSJ|nr:uncharacterized protein LOC4342662 [Oryza sativa Japonica Group]XP_015645490.1 uncharacterized protein LOC9267472 [Oryza sativa Japonica Group]KAB8104670.1 hypothetical protein EE612_037702 [Oryza sativa]KAB8104674.1 hypothetical protein EE612_037708 [Oryza sativa]BAT00489.1 Os07g0199000 [Oryza sativa Japonica Group]BAT00495.1 Os07g0200500 [Oryza sativa Japonica Group]